MSVAIDERERDLLAALLGSPESIPKVAELLAPSDFQSKNHQAVFRAILNVFFSDDNVSPNSVALFLKNNGNKNLIPFVFQLENSFWTDSSLLVDAQAVKDFSRRRQLAAFAVDLSKKAFNLEADFSNILDDAENDFHAFSLNSTDPLIDQSVYFNKFFLSQLERAKQYANRKNGFFNIDNFQIFSPGLYVLGATPACGKTTFAWQLLNQLSEKGERCIFCSYEMSALALYTKSLARQLFLKDHDSAFTAADIRRGYTSDSLNSIIKNFSTDNSKSGVSLLELQDESIDDLLLLLKPLCLNQDKPPVVCIDYLQIIPPSNDKKLISDKSKIDDIVRKLKSFQRKTNTTFIVISSFNRMNYYQHVSFESFKDSGNIEYTADVVWAFQLFALNSINPGDSISVTRKKIDDAKIQQPRQLQLKCLKNRNGMNYDAFFEYFSKHDFFKPCSLDDFTQANIDIPPIYSNSSAQINDDDFKTER